MKEENKKRINKLIIPFTRRTLAILGAVTISTTGLASCKKEDKNNSSDLTTSTITSSDTELEVSEEILGSSTISTEESSNIDNSQLNSSKADKVSSKPKNDTTKSSSKITNNNDSVQTPSVTTPNKPQTNMPSSLTASNINDIEVFKHFAAQFRNELDGDLLRFNGRLTDGEQEFQLMLALMNYDYVNDDTMYELFHNVSLSEMQELAYFVNALVSTTLNKNEYYNYNKYFIDKNFSNFMMSIQNNVPSKNQENLVNIFRGFYLDSNSKVKFNDNFWVDRYVCQIFAFIMDTNALNGDPLLSAYIDSLEVMNSYQDKVTEIYNKMSIKTKVKE